MHYVYVLKSQVAPKVYVGETADIPEERLAEHNSGSNTYSRKYKPWSLVSYIAVNTETEALALETYLKSGAGRAFISKYLAPKS